MIKLKKMMKMKGKKKRIKKKKKKKEATSFTVKVILFQSFSQFNLDTKFILKLDSFGDIY
jgi:hypothetical protein